MTNFSEMVSELAKPGENIVASLTPEKAHLLHMAIGICTEAGELLDAVKKHIIYEKPLDVSNCVEELGDLEFYMDGLRQSIGVRRELILAENMKKLSVRYGSGSYSNQSAQERKDKQ